jgi:hypothetical protein
LWWQISSSTIPIIETARDPWIFVGAIVCFAITLFALFTRNLAYVQASSNHIRVVTPLLRLNISYRRIRSIRQSNFSTLFPPHQAGWAQRSSLSTCYGKTVIVVGLKNFPISPRLLKLFMPKQMFSSKETGLVLLVPNWMALSTELDSYIASWRHKKKQREANIFAFTS